MTRNLRTIATILTAGGLCGVAACGQNEAETAAVPLTLAGVECETPPPLHCPDADCPGEMFVAPGNATDPDTGRQYFIDYPCDLQPGEPVNLILNIHGGGSIGNWQRHYFPALDYVDEYNLVVLTPTSVVREPVGMWTEADDDFLQGIVQQVIDQVGAENVNSFWLAGHSQGGMTSNRIVCTPYFADKVDGWLSLSGGRFGPITLPASFFGEGGAPAAITNPESPDAPRPGYAAMRDCDFNYIFTTGEHEMEFLPETSPWADRYNCDARVREDDIVDTKAGYVYSAARLEERNLGWGVEPRPGTAEVYVYPGCDEGKVVADVVRLDKGHTEGLEPLVTEHLIQMMVNAPNGKIREG
jgi:pimeloyl-ACP methyl ester carboxylesterase